MIEFHCPFFYNKTNLNTLNQIPSHLFTMLITILKQYEYYVFVFCPSGDICRIKKGRVHAVYNTRLGFISLTDLTQIEVPNMCAMYTSYRRKLMNV